MTHIPYISNTIRLWQVAICSETLQHVLASNENTSVVSRHMYKQSNVLPYRYDRELMWTNSLYKLELHPDI